MRIVKSVKELKYGIFPHILKGSKIGQNCKIGQNVVIGPDVSIGNGCKIQNNVSIYQGVTLEDEVFCGPSSVFTNVINPRSAIPRISELKPTLVKKGVTIGANATIICGNTIGKYVFIGADFEITIKDLVELIARLTGVKGKIIWDTSKPNGQSRRCLDVSKAEKEFGFKAKASFTEELKKTINWYISKRF